MHHLDLILTLTAGLAAALVLGYCTQRLGLSPIVGYLLAGIAVGPHTPGFVANREIAEQLAEVGVILLMFGVGLHFHLEDLFRVRRVAIPGAVAQSLLATLLGCLVAWILGWSWGAGLVFGLAISVASTVVLLRVLSDNHALHTPTGHIAVGWLIVEDIFTVLFLVFLPALLGGEQPGGFGSVLITLGWALFLLIILVLFTFFIGGKLIPWLLTIVAQTRSRELFTLTILVLALGIAVGSAKLFGASMALGAFLAGMVVGRSEFSLRAASEALPMRDAFAVLFFVSVGMLFNPAILWQAPGLVAATLAIILLGKPLAALAIVLFLRYPLRVALAVAVALAQIGEFSFILARLGRELQILPASAGDALVFAAIVSISINPLLFRLIEPAEAWIQTRPQIRDWLNRRLRLDSQLPGPGEEEPAKHRAIVVGYGPVGQTVVRLLHANTIEPTVIEMNLETVQRMKQEGTVAVYGDAARSETLHAAGAEKAIAMILTASGMPGSAEIIRQAKEINPEIRVIARTTYLREAQTLEQAGADAVFSAEGEVALSLTEFILRQLGATPEQIDREVERIRAELFGTARPADTLLTLPPPQGPT